MGYDSKKGMRRLTIIGTMSLLLTVGLAGCGKSSSDFSRGETGKQTVSAEVESKTDPNKGNGRAEEKEPYSALQLLRQSMDGTAETFAVAYLGYIEEDDIPDIAEWIYRTCPTLYSSYDFLSDIPKERIAGCGPAEVFCIIPRNAESHVEINHMGMNVKEGIMEPDACLYQADSGEPFLVLCNGEYDGMSQTQILIQDVSGSQTEWYPMMGESGRVMIPTTEELSYLAKDITEYQELGISRFYDWYGKMWSFVTPEQLQDTNWQMWIDATEELSAQYSIDFYTDNQMRLEWFYVDSDTQDEEIQTAVEEYRGSWSLTTIQEKTVLQLDAIQSGGRWYMEGKDIRDWQLQGDLYISEDEESLLLHVEGKQKLSMPGNDASTDTILMFRVQG